MNGDKNLPGHGLAFLAVPDIGLHAPSRRTIRPT
jgi:hypothetical protein